MRMGEDGLVHSHDGAAAAPPAVWRPGAGPVPWGPWFVAVVTAVAVAGLHGHGLGIVAGTGAAIGIAAWMAGVVLPVGTVRDVVLASAAVAGSAAVASTGGLMLTIAILAVGTCCARPGRRRWSAGLVVVTGAVIVATTGASWQAGWVLAAVCGVIVGAFAGDARGQAERAADQERLLRDRSIQAAREHDRARLLADRARLARDVHDALAHSLGGLSLQLGAAEALLAAGRTSDAAERVSHARALAGEGLAEARRALATLRDPSADPVPALGDDVLYHLVGAHRALGAVVVVDGMLDLRGVPADRSEVLARVTQEALSNARRHAPGQTTRMTARWHDGLVTVRFATPLAPEGTHGQEGSGWGLRGMRERVAELGDASTVSAGEVGTDFVVTVEVVLR